MSKKPIYEHPFQCPQCHRQYGVTDGKKLYLNNFVTFSITKHFVCPGCHAQMTWRPDADRQERAS